MWTAGLFFAGVELGCDGKRLRTDHVGVANMAAMLDAGCPSDRSDEYHRAGNTAGHFQSPSWGRIPIRRHIRDPILLPYRARCVCVCVCVI